MQAPWEWGSEIPSASFDLPQSKSGWTSDISFLKKFWIREHLFLPTVWKLSLQSPYFYYQTENDGSYYRSADEHLRLASRYSVPTLSSQLHIPEHSLVKLVASSLSPCDSMYPRTFTHAISQAYHSLSLPSLTSKFHFLETFSHL